MKSRDSNGQPLKSRENDECCWTDISLFQYGQFLSQAACDSEEFQLHVICKVMYLALRNVVKWHICLQNTSNQTPM